MAVALGVVFSLFHIPLPNLLYGGSVSMETLPIFVVAFRRGGKAGLAAGSVLGIVDFIIKPIVVHPVQVVLDYPLAFGLLGGAAGLAGSLRNQGAPAVSMYKRARIVAGILLGDGSRFLAHYLSGVVFFASYAPEGQPVWIYSLIYNASYMIPESIIHILLLQLILRILTLKME
jgi:thiamine transporter